MRMHQPVVKQKYLIVGASNAMCLPSSHYGQAIIDI